MNKKRDSGEPVKGNAELICLHLRCTDGDMQDIVDRCVKEELHYTNIISEQIVVQKQDGETEIYRK